MKTRTQNSVLRFGLSAACACLALLASNSNAQVLLSGGAYSQNFNTLPSAVISSNSWVNGTTLAGWYANCGLSPVVFGAAGSATNIIARVGDTTSGGFYSFGSNGVSDRALGAIGSGALQATSGQPAIGFGVRFTNDTGFALSNFVVSYTGEQWRNGGNASLASQPLTFGYRVNGLPITSADPTNAAVWTTVSALTFTSLQQSNSAVALDGNNATNRIAISSAITGFTVLSGQEVFFRWVDLNDAGNDHALAIDDLTISFETNFAAVASAPTISGNPTNRTIGEGQSATYAVNVAGTAPLTYLWYATNAGVETALSSAGSSVTTNFVPIAASGTGFYVIITNAQGAATSTIASLTVTNIPVVPATIQYLRTLVDANYVVNDTNTLFITTGIVTTAANVVPLTGVAGSVYSFHIQSGGYGIDVFHRGGFPTLVPAQGDSVEVKASLLDFGGIIEMQGVFENPTHSITVLSSGNPLPAPQPFDFSTIIPATMESSIEGAYVVISNVFIGLTNGATTLNNGAAFFLTNLLGQTFKVAVPTPAFLVNGTTPPAFASAVRGVISQVATVVPKTNGYIMLFTLNTDIDAGSPPSTNSALSALTITSGALTPGFAANTLSYSSPNVANATTSVTVTPTVADATATIQARVNGGGYSSVTSGSPSGALALNVGANTVDVKVTSQVGTTVTTYSVTVTRDAAAPSAPTPETITNVVSSGNLILSWGQTNWTGLLTGTNVTLITNEIIGATSPYTNAISGPQTYFRLYYKP